MTYLDKVAASTKANNQEEGPQELEAKMRKTLGRTNHQFNAAKAQLNRLVVARDQLVLEIPEKIIT